MIDWKIEKIGDNFLVTDYVANGSFASLSENVTYINTPDYAILVRTTDNTKKWNGNYVYVSENSFDFLKKSSLLLDDLIIANVGDPGKAFLCPDLGQPMTLGPNSILVRPLDKNKILNKYFYYYTTSKIGQRQIQDICSATAQKKFNKTSYRSLEIPLPPLPQQHKIVNILDAADELRQNDKALIAKYDELAQALFLDMFGDPVSNPKGWEKNKVIDYCDCIVPGRDKPKSFTGEIPWVTTDDLIHLGNTFNSKKNIGLTDDEILNVRAKKIPIESVIMTCVGNLGVITINKNEIIINQQLHAFQCFDKLNNVFLMHCLSYQKAYMYKMSSSTTVPYMNKTVCNNIPIIVPPIEFQTQFAEQLAIIEQQKAITQKSLEKSEELFNSLLQKAFKGELV